MNAPASRRKPRPEAWRWGEMGYTGSMSTLVTWLTPAPPPEAWPRVLPSPFDDVLPHPLARAAAEALMAQLRTGFIAPGFPVSLLQRPEGGKMFGVLVVTDGQGRLGTMRAFSGQLGRDWLVEGFAPPLFDEAERGRVEPASDVAVKAMTARLAELSSDPVLAQARGELARFDAAWRQERAASKAEREARKAARHARRQQAQGDVPVLMALDEESKRDDQARQREEAVGKAQRGPLAARVEALLAEVKALEAERKRTSQAAMRALHDTYTLRSFSGQRAGLRSLFAPGEPPWGAADCAAPKLFGAAQRLGLTPLALAEFWWGPPPPAGGRVEGAYFPACREKCGPVLPFLLDGLPVAPRQTVRPLVLGEGALTVRWEDARVVVVRKPPGMLSAPARDETVTDSALARLQARYPQATGPLLVHRLDLDTSGLLLAALDAEGFADLQRQFDARTVEKRYVAWLEGEVAADEGRIELPLRVDLDHRPRQVVDFVHGKPAVTTWRVLERRDGRTRVAFFPHTGRTHQLRVHAAHAQGLGVAIVGDRLYGQPGERLLLHAEWLRFRHPGTGAWVEVTDVAEF